MSLNTPILSSDTQGIKWAKLQRWLREAVDNAGIAYAIGQSVYLTDIRPGDTEGVKWAKLGAWMQLLADNIGGGSGGGDVAGNLSTTYVDATSGSDATGVVGQSGKPFQTIAAAFTAMAAATGNWICVINPGAYTDTGLIPTGANYNIFSHWEQGASWTCPASGRLYDLRTVNHNKPFIVLGHGNFAQDAGGTGRFIDSDFSVTTFLYYRIEGGTLLSANGGATAFFNLRGAGDVVESLRYPNELKFKAMDSNSGASAYLRVDTVIQHWDVSFLRGLDLDGGALVLKGGYSEAIFVGKNAFATPGLRLWSPYRLKGTGTPAIKVRRGQVYITTPRIEVTDGAAPCIQITADASTGAGEVQITVNPTVIRMWTGGSASAIDFLSSHANFRLRLIDCLIVQENSATDCIKAGAAQTIEVIGTLTTNLPLDSDITLKAGTGTLVTDAGIWTGF